MFKKKQLIDAETKTEDVKIEQKTPELNQDEIKTKKLIEEFNKYRGMFTPSDIVNMPEGAIKADELNLLFAVFAKMDEVKCLLEKIQQ